MKYFRAVPKSIGGRVQIGTFMNSFFFFFTFMNSAHFSVPICSPIYNPFLVSDLHPYIIWKWNSPCVYMYNTWVG